MAKASSKEYVATVGLNYPTASGEARVEAGATVSDLPAKSVSWLLDGGYIVTPDNVPADLEVAA
jgi:hypothetical protein